MIESAQWADAGHTIVNATIDGVLWWHIHMTEQGYRQRQVQQWIDAGNSPAEYEPDVR